MKRTIGCLVLVVLGVLAFSSLMSAVRSNGIDVGTYDASTGVKKNIFAVSKM